MESSPLWFLYALICAAGSAFVLLLPERLKCDGFALAFWTKASAFFFMIPFAAWMGMPQHWPFYGLVVALACLWAISDVIFFRSIPIVGAGVVSRLLPATVIVTFFVWFLIAPSTIALYADDPWRSAGIVLALCGSVYCATRLKRDAVSWAAVRMMWFVLVAAVVGPLLYKIAANMVTIEQGPFAYVMVEAFVMVCLWSVFFVARKPIPLATLLARKSMIGGAMVGAAMCVVSLSKFAAMHYVDNPGLVPAVKYLDAIFVMAYYRITGRVEKSDVAAGLGIVACAAILAVLKI